MATVKKRMIHQDEGFPYSSRELSCTSSYVLPTVLEELHALKGVMPVQQRRLFEIGCGNGATAHAMTEAGWDVTGVDVSHTGIATANEKFPNLKLHQGSAYDDLVETYGRFPVVVSLEVVEHLYFPRAFASKVFSLLEPGGTAIISTPFHGYWKNLLLAISGRFDEHFTALWDYGHIKFWSMRTLGTLLEESGLSGVRFQRVGRVPPLAKSMIAIARRPLAS